MAKLSTEELLDQFKDMTLIELSDFVGVHQAGVAEHFGFFAK